MNKTLHIPVLKTVTIDLLNPHLASDNWIIDCTAGLGGHLEYLLSKIPQQTKVIAIDKDKKMITYLKKKFIPQIQNNRLFVIQDCFSNIDVIAKQFDAIGKIHAIYADLGISSKHLDDKTRGFSFLYPHAFLDMRLDPNTNHTTAQEILNEWSKRKLADIFRKYVQEKNALRLAEEICKKRQKTPILYVIDLKKIVNNVIKHDQKDTLAKIFLALRIAVNDEINVLKTFLPKAFEVLAPKGRLAVISFHSTEDKIVKQFFLKVCGIEKKLDLPKFIPLTAKELSAYIGAQANIIKPFPIMPSSSEIEQNPRCRSAKLRILEKH